MKPKEGKEITEITSYDSLVILRIYDKYRILRNQKEKHGINNFLGSFI